MRRPGNVITIRLGYADTLTFAGRWDWIRSRRLYIEDQY